MQIARRAILALALVAGLVPAVAQVPPPVPALPDAERRTTYSISGSVCSCAVGFQLYGDSTDYVNWLEVFVNGVLVPQSGNWTIASPTGSLATMPRPITDAVLTFTAAQTGTVQIVGARRPRRTTQFQEGQPVPTRNFNQTFSDITATLRELWDKTNDFTGRSVRAPPGETLNLLPMLSGRASMNACFDSGGNLTSCVQQSSGSFAAGNGIAFSGTNPTTITNNIQAGAGITVTGTNPLVLASTARTILTADTTFFVDRALGIDVAGCGLTSGGGACQSIQYFVNILQSSYDLRLHQATIQLANSTSPAYGSALITGKWVGGTSVTIQGNTGSPGSVLIDGGGAGYCIQATEGAIITVQGVKLQNCSLELQSDVGGSQVYFQQVEFGAPVAGGISVYCTRQSYCEVIGGGNIISGIGANFIQASHQGNFRAANVTAQPFTLTADLTLAGGGAFAAVSSGGEITFTGYTASAFNLNGHTVTGQRWAADSDGLFQLLNASTGKSMAPTFFPGTAGGSCTGDCAVDQSGHFGVAAAACGSGGGASGTDIYGQVIEGTAATGCTITFGSAFSTAPFCLISWFTTSPTNVVYTTSTTGIVMTHDSADVRKFNFQCKGS